MTRRTCVVSWTFLFRGIYGHHILTATESTYGQSASDSLPQSCKVCLDIENLLSPTCGQPEADHLITDKEHTIGAGNVLQEF